MNFQDKRDQMNSELEKFISSLNEVLPRYALLLKKTNLSADELTELGEMEYFLIEVNAKIAEIKKVLSHDLFGLSIDLYYQIKAKAKTGDVKAKIKMDKMRDTFNESLKTEAIIHWN
jgi:hypothetical protein